MNTLACVASAPTHLGEVELHETLSANARTADCREGEVSLHI